MTDDSPQHMDRRDIATLLAVMRRLRDPERGCPWDIRQTFASIAPYTIEEAYEVADAIERRDMNELRDELGDLLLQVVFHARMAEEAGHFAFPDVVEAIVSKMIFRHPHVFGDGKPPPADFWERAKEAEREQNGKSAAGALDDVPLALPALTRAVKLQKKAARGGYDWPDASGVLDKLAEEARELAAAQDPAAREEELGDVLFTLVNLARHLKIDPEKALRAANDKFARRFRAAERAAQEQGRKLADLSPQELDALWETAKKDA